MVGVAEARVPAVELLGRRCRRERKRSAVKGCGCQMTVMDSSLSYIYDACLSAALVVDVQTML